VQPGTGAVVVAVAAGRGATQGTENRWRQLKREAGRPRPRAPADLRHPPRAPARGLARPGGLGAPHPRLLRRGPRRLAPVVGEFDYGSGRMRAGRLTHASRAGPPGWRPGGRGVRGPRGAGRGDP